MSSISKQYYLSVETPDAQDWVLVIALKEAANLPSREFGAHRENLPDFHDKSWQEEQDSEERSNEG